MASNFKNFLCEICEKSFKLARGLGSHKNSKEHKERLKTHMNTLHNSLNTLHTTPQDTLHTSNTLHSTLFSSFHDDFEFQDFDNFFDRELLMTDIFKTYFIKASNEGTYNIITHIMEKEKEILKHINNHRNIKFQIELKVVFYNPKDKSHYSFKILSHQAKKIGVTKATTKDLEEVISDFPNQADTDLIKLKGSGWILLSLSNIKIHVSRIKILLGGSYIKLPFRDHTCVNVKNENNDYCFAYSIFAQLLNKESNPQRPSHYQYMIDKMFDEDQTYIKFKKEDFPMTLTNIQKFEIRNGNHIKVNVYGIKRKPETDGALRKDYMTFPLYSSKLKDSEVDLSVKLLYIRNNEGKSHYVLIKNFEGYLKSELDYSLGLGPNEKLLFCERCTSHFLSDQALANHVRMCENEKNPSKIVMPKEGENILKFNNYSKLIKIPIILTADIECINLSISSAKKENQNSTDLVQQVPNSICIYRTSAYPELIGNEMKIFKGENCEDEFTKYIIEQEKMCMNLLAKNTPLKFSPEDEEVFNDEHVCRYCEKIFDEDEEDENLTKVKDHDHFNGKYRCAAHKICNLNAKKPEMIPLYFHNGSNYDFHLLIKPLAKNINKEIEQALMEIADVANSKEYMKKKNFLENHFKIKIIPLTDEKYISFSYGCIRFSDSIRLFQKGLDKVAESMKDEDFIELKSYFKEKHEIMKLKGIYPYEYIDSFERLNETQLPSIDKFYSKLKQASVPEKDYQRALEVWNYFECETLWDYTLIYLIQDTLLLSDAIGKFRNIYLDKGKVDPAHYVSAPGLTWDCGLSDTKIELELLTDQSMYEMFESGIRGGISSVMGKRHVKAHNPYTNPNSKYIKSMTMEKAQEIINLMKEGKPLPKDLVNENKEFISDYLFYIDANNLYGWAMSQYLPYKNFKWEQPTNELVEKILNTPGDSDVGYVLDVDLEYTDKETTKRFPLAPEKKNNLLINDLTDKENYVIHYRNLQFYLSKGMTIKKVNRIISFEQKPWLKVYIDLNTKRRSQKGLSDFEKDLWKLMNNAFFGKTMENVRKRVNIELETIPRRAMKQASKPTYIRFHKFSDELYAIKKHKVQVKLNKPIYLGFGILELSKLFMYEFFYEKLVKKWENLELLYMDTDSFVLDIKSEDIYKDLDNDPEFKDNFDFADFDEKLGRIRFISKEDQVKYNKVIGKFKDELGGKVMSEFIAIRSKSYAFTNLETPAIKIKNKGIQSDVIKKHMNFDHFKSCLFDNMNNYQTVFTLHSKEHDMLLTQTNKLALNNFDRKRFILEDGINTRPFYSNIEFDEKCIGIRA